jgi:hypothetical protein
LASSSRAERAVTQPAVMWRSFSMSAAPAMRSSLTPTALATSFRFALTVERVVRMKKNFSLPFLPDRKRDLDQEAISLSVSGSMAHGNSMPLARSDVCIASTCSL